LLLINDKPRINIRGLLSNPGWGALQWRVGNSSKNKSGGERSMSDEKDSRIVCNNNGPLRVMGENIV
jgi:hypothetical protein